MVSLSRTSPIMMQSGAWRSAFFRPTFMSRVSVPTSRWFTIDFLFWKMNSTGSSSVRICPVRCSLRKSSMAARVVDFPPPVVDNLVEQAAHGVRIHRLLVDGQGNAADFDIDGRADRQEDIGGFLVGHQLKQTLHRGHGHPLKPVSRSRHSIGRICRPRMAGCEGATADPPELRRTES